MSSAAPMSPVISITAGSSDEQGSQGTSQQSQLQELDTVSALRSMHIEHTPSGTAARTHPTCEHTPVGAPIDSPRVRTLVAPGLVNHLEGPGTIQRVFEVEQSLRMSVYTAGGLRWPAG